MIVRAYIFLLAFISYVQLAQAGDRCPLLVDKNEITAEELGDFSALGFDVTAIENLNVETVDLLNVLTNNSLAYVRRKTGNNIVSRYFSKDKQAYFYFRFADPLNASQVFKFGADVDPRKVVRCEIVKSEISKLRQERTFSAVASQALDPKTFTNGGLILALEGSAKFRRGEQAALRQTLNGYYTLQRKIQAEFKKLETQPLDLSRKPSYDQFISLVNIIRTSAREMGLMADCQNASEMGNYFVQGCGNCISDTMLILSLIYDLGLQPPDGFQLGAESFADHIAPVMFNSEKNEIIDLDNFDKRTMQNPIVDFAYLKHNALQNVRPVQLQSEPELTTDQGSILFTTKDSVFPAAVAGTPTILDELKIPHSHNCWIKDCKPAPANSIHAFSTVVGGRSDDQDQKPDDPLLDRGETCPFITSLPLSIDPMLASGRMLLHSKRLLMAVHRNRGLDFKPLTMDVLNAKDVIHCEGKSAMITYRDYNDQDHTLLNERHENDADLFLLRSMRRGAGDQVLPVLVLPASNCPSEPISNAVQLCNLARDYQAQAAADYAQKTYPLIERLLSTKDVWSDYRMHSPDWLQLQVSLKDVYKRLFNESRSHSKTIELLEKNGIDIKNLLMLARKFRKQNAIEPIQFFIDFSLASKKQQLQFFDVLSRVSEHLAFLSRHFNEMANSQNTVAQFSSGLFEEQLRYLLQNKDFRFVAADVTEIANQVTDKFAIPDQQDRPPHVPELNLPVYPRIAGAEEACKNSAVPYLNYGSIAIDCRKYKSSQVASSPTENTEDPRRLIHVSGLLLPLLMAESEREALRPRNLLYEAYLWNSFNDTDLAVAVSKNPLERFFHASTGFDWTQLMLARVFFSSVTPWNLTAILEKADQCSKACVYSDTVPSNPVLLMSPPDWLSSPVEQYAYRKVQESSLYQSIFSRINQQQDLSPWTVNHKAALEVELSNALMHFWHQQGLDPSIDDAEDAMTDLFLGLAHQRILNVQTIKKILTGGRKDLVTDDTDLSWYDLHIGAPDRLNDNQEPAEYGRTFILEKTVGNQFLIYPFGLIKNAMGADANAQNSLFFEWRDNLLIDFKRLYTRTLQ